MSPLDTLRRPLRNLRVSVTDRCNLRCSYCMPEDEYVWLPRTNLLTFEEVERLVRAFTLLGVHKLRLTGGEPLLRKDLARLIGMMRGIEGLETIALTTNGVLLADQAQGLKDAGLDRVTVSLDSLRRERVERMTRSDCLSAVLAGIDAARAAGFRRIKLDTVLVKDVNDDELFDLVEFARSTETEIRFIEYMDVGGATDWREDKVVSRAEILERLQSHYGGAEQLGERNSAPADRYRLPDGTVLGIISSTTQPFCSACDRARLTADGTLYTCLYATQGRDLRELLRAGAGAQEIAERVAGIWRQREDRGAEQRLEEEQRGILVPRRELEHDPRLEMHTRGG